MVSGVLVLGLWWLFDIYLGASLLLLIFAILFLFVAAIDAYSYVIPDRLLILMALIAIIGLIPDFNPEPLFAMSIVALAGALIYYATDRIWNKKVLGMGDLKLIAIIALFSGWEVGWILYFAVISGGVFALAGILFKKLERTSKVPFAPFLFIAFLLVEGTELREKLFFFLA